MGLMPWPSCKDRNTKPEAVTLAPGSLAAVCAKSFCAKAEEIANVHRPSAIKERRVVFKMVLTFKSMG
jgi:hypothetical protein